MLFLANNVLDYFQVEEAEGTRRTT